MDTIRYQMSWSWINSLKIDDTCGDTNGIHVNVIGQDFQMVQNTQVEDNFVEDYLAGDEPRLLR